MRYAAAVFIHKLDLLGKVAKVLGQKIKNVYGFGLKIAIVYF
jgi:hypothetical protein